MALDNALGKLVRFVLLPGQRHDTIAAPPMIEGIDFGALLGDRAFDVDWRRAELDARVGIYSGKTRSFSLHSAPRDAIDPPSRHASYDAADFLPSAGDRYQKFVKVRPITFRSKKSMM